MTIIENFKSWTFALCTASMCGAILNMLLPDGSEKKIFKTVLCLFLLCTMFLPILSTDFSKFDVDFKIDDNGAQMSTVTEELLNFSAESAKEAIINDTKDILSENGIVPNNISLSVNISADGSINISGFYVSVANGDAENIQKIVEKRTGLVPEIQYLGETNDGGT